VITLLDVEPLSLYTPVVSPEIGEKLVPLKKEVSKIRERTRGMEAIPQKVAAIEQLVNQLNSQLMENTERLNELFELIKSYNN